MKSIRMGWVGHVARMGGRGGSYRVLVGKREGMRLLGIIRLGGKKILKSILKKYCNMELF
jgi:hypothetical protein